MKYNPRSKAENLNIGIYEKRLPSGIEGFYISDGLDKFIVVDSTLTEIKKNCVITHELIHHQRTPGCEAVAHFSVTEAIPVRKAERKVEKETALALISDRELEDAVVVKVCKCETILDLKIHRRAFYFQVRQLITCMENPNLQHYPVLMR